MYNAYCVSGNVLIALKQNQPQPLLSLVTTNLFLVSTYLLLFALVCSLILLYYLLFNLYFDEIICLSTSNLF